jgi:hypothetical protein
MDIFGPGLSQPSKSAVHVESQRPRQLHCRPRFISYILADRGLHQVVMHEQYVYQHVFARGRFPLGLVYVHGGYGAIIYHSQDLLAHF